MEGKPLKLVSFTPKENNDYNYEIDSDTLEFVRSQKCEFLTTVGIIGKYRSGKSFIMNQLIPRGGDFKVTSNYSGETQGIWVKLVDHPTNKLGKLLLIDTEGFNDARRKNKDSEKICVMFCLAMCDLLIVNVQENIDENILETLGSPGEILKLAFLESSLNLPHVTVAIRNFILRSEVNGKHLTSDQYLEYILQNTDDDSEFSKLRQAFKDLFNGRNCITFGIPCEPHQIPNLKNYSSHVYTEFAEKVEILRNQVLDIEGKCDAKEFANKVRPNMKLLYETMHNLELSSKMSDTNFEVVKAWLLKAKTHFESELTRVWDEAWKVAKGYKRPWAGRQKTREIAEDAEIPETFAKCVEKCKSETLLRFTNSKLISKMQLEDTLDKVEEQFVEMINEESVAYLMRVLDEELQAIANAYFFASKAKEICLNICNRCDRRLIYGESEKNMSAIVKKEVEEMKFSSVDKSNRMEFNKKLLKAQMNWHNLSLTRQVGTILASSISGTGTALGTVAAAIGASGAAPISIPARLFFTGAAGVLAAGTSYLGNKVLADAGNIGRESEEDLKEAQKEEKKEEQKEEKKEEQKEEKKEETKEEKKEK